MKSNVMRESSEKRSSCSNDLKYGGFILEKSQQQLKIQSDCGIFDSVIGEGQ